MPNTVHPMFQHICETFHTKLREDAKAAAMDSYKLMLRTHDWGYDYTDDHSVWSRQHAMYLNLLDMRREIDPDCKVWNSIAPKATKLVSV